MFGKSKRSGLLILLMAALVFMGINFLGAKKPQQYTWTVKIPTTSKNLVGYQVEYSNRVGAKKYKGGPTTGYYLSLDIINTQDDDTCDAGLNREIIGFQGLYFSEDDTEVDEDGSYCYFPPSFPPPGVDPTCSDTPAECMKCFLENYPHPNCGYYSLTLLIRVDCDIEDITEDITNPASCSGKVYIDVRNTFDVLEYDEEKYHNIYSATDVNLDIYSDATNTWTIEVNDFLDFEECYKVKKGKGKKNWEYKNPLRTTTPFSFVTTWTRS